MSEPFAEIDPNIHCNDCVGACCRRGTLLIMSRLEVKNNQRKMRLKKLASILPFDQDYLMQAERYDDSGNRYPAPTAIEVPAGYGAYILMADCGNLTPDFRCSIYDDPTKPKVCENFVMGSLDCVSARAAFGLGTVIVEISKKPTP